ncbi:hypothetical protein B1B00_08645 [Bacillus sp. DSM 27956]|nr:hypothetical protein B1B00_08645 [Bacillus sp. DSM 27956]
MIRRFLKVFIILITASKEAFLDVYGGSILKFNALKVLLKKDFLFFLLARQVDALGDWILLISLPFYIYNITGSTFAMSGMFLIQMAPRLLFGSVAGVFVDQWNNKKTMVVCDLLRALILLPLFFMDSTEWLWIIYVVGFMQSTISTFFRPASASLLPDIVGRENLVEANSISAISSNFTRLFGPTIGGALFGVFGINVVILTDIISYLLASLLTLLISVSIYKTNPVQTEVAKNAKSRFLGFWGQWIEGLLLVKQQRLLYSIFLITGFSWLAQGIINVLFLPFVKDILNKGAFELGMIETAEGVGGLIGGILLLQLNKKVPTLPLIIFSAGFVGIAFLVIFNSKTLLITLVVNGLLGIPSVIFFTKTETLLQTFAPKEFIGRIFGSYHTTVALMMMCGMFFASLLEKWLGILTVLNIAGSLYVVSGITAFVLLNQVHLTNSKNHSVES